MTKTQTDGGLARNPVIDEIAAERQRQISEEGWTPEHDDQHTHCELAAAAACYAMAVGAPDEESLTYKETRPPLIWPWDATWWKPSTERRDLVKAGALIVAEIERLDRLAARETDNG